MSAPSFRPILAGEPSLRWGTVAGAAIAGVVVALVIPAASLWLQERHAVQTSAPTIYGCPAPQGEETLVITVVQRDDATFAKTCAVALSLGARRRAAQ